MNPFPILLAALSAFVSPLLTAEPAPAPSLIKNGSLEEDADGDQWPDQWPRHKTATWPAEEGNHFIRLKSATPGETVLLYNSIPIPKDAKALRLSWRQRVTDLKVGPKPWFDARIMLEFRDTADKKLPDSPNAPNTRKSTDGWVSKSIDFLVPEGAAVLAMMPALFQVESGTFDLDDFVLQPIGVESVPARQNEGTAAAGKAQVAFEEPKKDAWPKPIHVVGNKILNSDDKEIWLQGLNIPSLEWSVGGEQVLKSTIVAIDDWKSNVIRIPVNEEYWFGQKGQSDAGKSYRDVVDQMITLAANRGAYVILDLHRFRAPKPEFLEFWKDAATRYKDHPALIFDLMNEPHGISWEIWRSGGFVGEKKDADQAAFLSAEDQAKAQGFQSPGMQALLDAVRSTGAKNVVLIGGLDYAYQLDGILNGFALDDKSGNGIIYSSHVYPWKKDWQKYFLDLAAIYPVLLGEVGADAKKMDFMPPEIQEDVETWAPDVIALIQQHKLHWTAWCFHPKSTPRMILDWDYTPTPFWGQLAKDALAGRQFELKKLR